MKLDKIGSYIASAQNDLAQKIEKEKTKETSTESNSAAVSFSDDFVGGSEESIQARKQKVERIKSEVQAGLYKADSREVAKSLIRELFV